MTAKSTGRTAGDLVSEYDNMSSDEISAQVGRMVDSDKSTVITDETKARLTTLTGSEGIKSTDADTAHEAMLELKEILASIQEDADRIVDDTRKRIEEMVTEAGGDATSAVTS
jgi:hypothetical protein